VSQQRFIRCPHCGLPHEADAEQCELTGKAIERPKKRKQIVAPPSRPVWRTPIPDGEVEMEESPSVTRLFGMTVDDKYRIDELIGRGGMGVVYRAEHVRLKKPVAIKVLLRGHEAGSHAKRRFEREARAAGMLGHPNIVQVFDIGSLPGGSPFLVMELLEGETLADRLDIDGALGIDDACDFLSAVLGALDVAHGKGIVHRDMKPDNVFLTKMGNVKLLDFGISKNIVDEETMSLTKTGAVVGTPYYLAPEQARGERKIDHRVDLWAVGIVLYEALTGMLPFSAENYNALLAKILTKRPAPPMQSRPTIPPQLDDVVMKALAYEPNERFQSASAFRDALQNAKKAPRLQPPKIDVVKRAKEMAAMTDRPTVDLGPGPEDPTEISDSFVHADVDLKIGSDES